MFRCCWSTLLNKIGPTPKWLLTHLHENMCTFLSQTFLSLPLMPRNLLILSLNSSQAFFFFQAGPPSTPQLSRRAVIWAKCGRTWDLILSLFLAHFLSSNSRPHFRYLAFSSAEWFTTATVLTTKQLRFVLFLPLPQEAEIKLDVCFFYEYLLKREKEITQSFKKKAKAGVYFYVKCFMTFRSGMLSPPCCPHPNTTKTGWNPWTQLSPDSKGIQTYTDISV